MIKLLDREGIRHRFDGYKPVRTITELNEALELATVEHIVCLEPIAGSIAANVTADKYVVGSPIECPAITKTGIGTVRFFNNVGLQANAVLSNAVNSALYFRNISFSTNNNITQGAGGTITYEAKTGSPVGTPTNFSQEYWDNTFNIIKNKKIIIPTGTTSYELLAVEWESFGVIPIVELVDTSTGDIAHITATYEGLIAPNYDSPTKLKYNFGSTGLPNDYLLIIS